MSDDRNTEVSTSISELRTKLVRDHIRSMVVLARQRGLPVNGFSEHELDNLTIEDLKEIQDGLHELIYAPPPRK